MIENPQWREKFKFNGLAHKVFIYDTISVETQGMADVLEIRDGTGLRIAWAHLFHTSVNELPVTVVKEFYVWPWFRRQGYGTKLDEMVCERSRFVGSKAMRVYFHEADTIVTEHKYAGYHFSKKLGYQKTYKITNCPRLTAIAEKSL
jgi:GNAT superfamily N-acetyltransferase